MEKITPKKQLGQNFLADQTAISKVLAAAEISPTDFVLEIGPGTGVLTIELAQKAQKIIAIEKDPEMIAILKEKLTGVQNIEVVQGDIRGFDPKNYQLKPKNYKIVANIPYYLTAFLIRSFLEQECPPKDLTLVIQKEVAQRICAKPPKMNLLAVSVQFYAQPKISSYIKKTSFWPVPKVDSAIIKITLNDQIITDNKEVFFKIIHAGFAQPRKQLLNNLAGGLKMDKKSVESWLLRNNIQPTQRAETLTLENWLGLTKTYF